MRIMAIDYGDAHTGVAISDVNGFLTGFSTVIHSRKMEAVAEQIAALAQERDVEELVLGNPKNMDGTPGTNAEKVERLADMLKEKTALPLVLWDERRTTVEAHQILFNNGKNGQKRKKIVDAVAASLILEGYLTYRRNTRQ